MCRLISEPVAGRPILRGGGRGDGRRGVVVARGRRGGFDFNAEVDIKVNVNVDFGNALAKPGSKDG